MIPAASVRSRSPGENVDGRPLFVRWPGRQEASAARGAGLLEHAHPLGRPQRCVLQDVHEENPTITTEFHQAAPPDTTADREDGMRDGPIALVISYSAGLVRRLQRRRAVGGCVSTFIALHRGCGCGNVRPDRPLHDTKASAAATSALPPGGGLLPVGWTHGVVSACLRHLAPSS